MTKWIRQISEWGITSDTPSEQAYHFRLTNVLLLFMFFASIAETILLYATGANASAMLNATAPFAFGGGLLLMKLGYTLFSRVAVLTIAFSAGYVLVASLGPESYFQFIFLFASAFAMVFFSNSERILRLVGIGAPLIAFVSLELTGFHPVLLPRSAVSPQAYATMRAMSVVIIWLVMTIHFSYFIRGRKKLEEQLISSAKMVAMGRVAAGIAHEVNNPLQTIVYNAEKLQAAAESGTVDIKKVGESAAQINNVAMRIATIVKSLLALSRDASTYSTSEVELNEVVSSALDFCRSRFEGQNIKIDFNHDLDLHLRVNGRGPQLSEVVLNVLNNAFDAVHEDGEKWIKIELRKNKDLGEIAISNGGRVIDPRFHSRIFDPFFTTKPVGLGTGLGLSICQNILASHSGTIALDTSCPCTCFVIQLPLMA